MTTRCSGASARDPRRIGWRVVVVDASRARAGALQYPRYGGFHDASRPNTALSGLPTFNRHQRGGNPPT
jgi:hypothetical protein